MKQIKKIKIELSRLNVEESVLQQKLEATVDYAESKNLREELSNIRRTKIELLKDLEMLTRKRDHLLRDSRQFVGNSIVYKSGRWLRM